MLVAVFPTTRSFVDKVIVTAAVCVVVVAVVIHIIMNIGDVKYCFLWLQETKQNEI